MDIAALARLAKLDLAPEEEAKLRPQIEEILGQFASLSELPAVPLSIPSGQDSRLREDIVVPAPNEMQDKLLGAGKHRQANFIRLPSVF